MVERNSLIEMTQEKPCRACTDFKSWVKQQKQAYSAQTTNGKDEDNQSKKSSTNQRTDCPLTRSEVGQKTWAVLHTVAAYYPDQPTEEQKSDMKNFFYILSKFYPCSYCAEDFREQLKNNPPETSSQMELSQWLCRIHNEVNVKIGKPEFDCKLVNQRWRDGWLDGSCD